MEIVKSKPVDGWCKSHALYLKQGNALTPVCYFRKPKHVSAEAFEALMSDMQIICSRQSTDVFANEGGK